jgi:hypothetical protein
MAKMANTVRRYRLILLLAFAAFAVAAALLLLREPPIEPEWNHQIPEVVLWQ